MDDTRFYSFVAGLYLSELQKGLQTAHAVSEMYADYKIQPNSPELALYDQWAEKDKTIVILNAHNAKGVKEAFLSLTGFAAHFRLPLSIFHEDMDSLNGSPTATGIVVPARFYRVEFDPGVPVQLSSYFHEDSNGKTFRYIAGSIEYSFIEFLKSYRLA